MDAHTQRLIEAEKDLLLEKLGRLDLLLAEGAWTGSHGGHDTADFNKLKGGLKRFWVEKAATSPHPFAYCVRHLRKHVADPERLCAWLKDQALGTTKWRNGGKMTEAAWQPDVEELRSAVMAYTEAAEELGLISEGAEAGGEGEAQGGAPDTGGAPDDAGQGGAVAGAEGSEAGGEGASAAEAPPAEGPDGEA